MATKRGQGTDGCEGVVVVGVSQYWDSEDGRSAFGVRRHYRYSLEVVRAATARWRAASVAAAVVLGDHVDQHSGERGAAHLAEVRAAFGAGGAGAPEYHWLAGNHDLALFSRQRLKAALGIQADGAADRLYRQAAPAPGLRFVILDPYEISVFDPEGGEAERREAAQAGREFLRRKREGRATGSSWNSPQGLAGLDRRFTALNGAFGPAQLEWLEATLARADAAGERAVVFSHVPVLPGAQSFVCGTLCLAWNYEAIVPILERHASAVALFSGHDHGGGYKVSEAGVHHVTLPGVIETPLGQQAFGIVEVYGAGLFLRGFGRVKSRWMPFRPAA